MTDTSPATGPYGRDIDRIRADYPQHDISRRGFGYSAQLKAADGPGHVGHIRIKATLDELAAAMDEHLAAVRGRAEADTTDECLDRIRRAYPDATITPQQWGMWEFALTWGTATQTIYMGSPELIEQRIAELVHRGRMPKPAAGVELVAGLPSVPIRRVQPEMS